MLCTDEERQAKRVRIATFVDNFLIGLRATASNRDVQTAIDSTRSELSSGVKTSAQAVKDARRQLGQNNESYLQLSVMVLWSGEGSDENHLLYPASANTERDMNESTLRSMARVAQDDYNQILKQLQIAKCHHQPSLSLIASLSTVSTACPHTLRHTHRDANIASLTTSIACTLPMNVMPNHLDRSSYRQRHTSVARARNAATTL